MADTLLSFGVEKLWDLLTRESERLQGVEEQFNDLKSDLETLRCFMKDADAMKHTSATMKSILNDIKEIVYDAEDVVEIFLRNEELQKTSGIMNNVRRYSCAFVKQRRLAIDIEAISKRISKVIRKMKILGVQQVTGNQGYTEVVQERQREVRQTFSNDNESVIVGLDGNVAELVEYLVKEDNTSQVVSIIGMGGIGKTTLARQIFHHETVKSHFASRLAWVCVSQQFTRKFVWQTVLRELRPEYKVSDMEEDELQKKISQVLETEKALIVLDDIWREGDWDRIKPMFPREKGWKVLLTSRSESVGLRADPNCFTFRSDFLTPNESWILLQMIAFSKEDTTENKVDKEMEEIGKQMIKHCGGLPLAVKVLGGMLAAKYTFRKWKYVSENIGSHVVGGTSFNDRNINSVYHVLYLSFEELPSYLKHCFLYFAHFPEDYPVNVDKLSYYWAAEGIPRPRCYDGLTIREVGDGYIEELVKRNMVISERDVRTSRFETCQLHDMMREVCLLKAEEENFLQVVHDQLTDVNYKSRRLVIQGHEGINGTLREIKDPKIRSLLFLNQFFLPLGSSLCFTRLRLMRILDLSEVVFEGGKLSSSIGEFIHLRYLSLYKAKVTHLPFSLGNLKLLLYLNLNVGAITDRVYMPNFLKDMSNLIYLCLPESLHSEMKLEMGNLVNLESLLNFSTANCSMKDLQGMTRLETLSIIFSASGDERCMEVISSSLSELGHVENLSITFGECLYLEEDPMPFLERMFHLKELTFSGDSFYGKRMVCSTGGFPQLHKLEFGGFNWWKKWIVEEGSMPRLRTLSIYNCLGLRKLPDGLLSITSLKELHVSNTFFSDSESYELLMKRLY